MMRRTPTHKVQRGNGWMSALAAKAKAAHNFVRERKLLSRTLASNGHPKLAAFAKMAGYGRRRPAARARVTKRATVARKLGVQLPVRRVARKRAAPRRIAAPSVRRVAVPRRSAGKQRGRGFFGKTLGGIGGGLLGGLLPF